MTRRTWKTKFELIERNNLIDLIYIGKRGSEWRYVGRTKEDLIMIIGYGGYVSYQFDKEQSMKILEMMRKTTESQIYKKYKFHQDKKNIIERITK